VGSARLDVVSEGTFIEKGKKVKVVEVEGNRVVVRELEHPSLGKEG
jgi:membrane-bound serine protease (ClpP class)